MCVPIKLLLNKTKLYFLAYSRSEVFIVCVLPERDSKCGKFVIPICD